ncbi:MAG: hypothetical protein NZ898_06485, partial [Myxococcota bacterium]|nr:hypothetical protein [Myxococcota bacterium]
TRADLDAAIRAARDLDDMRATSSPRSDVVAAFQGPRWSLGPGERAAWGVAVLWALDEDAAPDVEAVRAWSAGLEPHVLLERELAEQRAWLGPLPPGLRADEARLWRASEVVLRMAQVREPGRGFGQILASLPPGLGHVDSQWNIAWVRDMAYATVALARSGHLEEAAAALRFQIAAGPGRHTAIVGRPYRISITRYFGDGSEESDCNADGPNIEFDGFGLFLWSLAETVRAGFVMPEAWWSVVEDEIADVLVSLRDETGGLRPDSSIWEVHWNGRQRRFTYSALAAVRGLCDVADLARAAGRLEAARRWRDAALGIRHALLERHRDRRGALGQSQEDVAIGHHYADAAAIEGISWSVFDPGRRTAQATVAMLLDALRVPTGVGWMRNDDGGWYDSQEWVFIGLRALPALRAVGLREQAERLDAWLLGQALANDLQWSELHDARTGRYAGSIPMVGFGAGAYILSRLPLPEPPCGEYAPDEPALLPLADGGVPEGDAGTADGSAASDGGLGDGPAASPDGERPPRAAGTGCACRASHGSRSHETAALISSAIGLAAGLGRYRRGGRRS